MTDGRLDLSALDDRGGDEAMEALVLSIGARASAELARRSGARGPFLVLAGWAMPTFAAAAVLAAVSLLGLGMARSGDDAPRLRGLSDEMGLPAPIVEWVSEDRAPTHEDLLLAMESDLR